MICEKKFLLLPGYKVRSLIFFILMERLYCSGSAKVPRHDRPAPGIPESRHPKLEQNNIPNNETARA